MDRPTCSYTCSKTGIVFIRSSEFASEWELYGKDPSLPREELFMAEPLLLAFDEVRRDLGGPLIITSGRRSLAKQAELFKNPNVNAGRVSTHCYGLALDVQVPWGMKDSELAKKFVGTCWRFAERVPRCGYLWYRDAKLSSYFLHVDLGPLLFRKDSGEPLLPGLPDSWRKEGLIF